MSRMKQAAAAAMEKAREENVDLAIATLTGDVRDVILTHIRAMQDPWAKLSEVKQQEKITAATMAAEMLVRRCAQIVGANGFESIAITIGKFAASEGTIKATFEAQQTHDHLVKISDMQGRRSLLVLVDPDDFTGERAPAKPDKDEPPLDLADAAE